jgi:hypothetical protein
MRRESPLLSRDYHGMTGSDDSGGGEGEGGRVAEDISEISAEISC